MFLRLLPLALPPHHVTDEELGDRGLLDLAVGEQAVPGFDEHVGTLVEMEIPRSSVLEKHVSPFRIALGPQVDRRCVGPLARGIRAEAQRPIAGCSERQTRGPFEPCHVKAGRS